MGLTGGPGEPDVGVESPDDATGVADESGSAGTVVAAAVSRLAGS
jgi:hypothetical protein